jgi:hypothetical protein
MHKNMPIYSFPQGNRPDWQESLQKTPMTLHVTAYNENRGAAAIRLHLPGVMAASACLAQ